MSGDDEAIQKRRKLIAELTTRARELRSIARCKNVLNFASSHEGMGILAKHWDTNKWLLAVPNGVIDLRSGECKPGQPGDHIRTVCPTEWRGLNTTAPRWERFLQEIFEDRDEQKRTELIEFLRRLFGYGTTGETREHVFAVLYGEDGRNGKDTLQRAISQTLGEASGAISKDVFLDAGRQRNAGGATPHLCDLQGKRLAWANEPEKGARFNAGQVKDLSGGGDIPVRPLYAKDYYNIKPTHLLVLLTNHKPHADATDTAFWERLRLITFNMRFVDKPVGQNERLKDATLWDTLEQEAPGILAWLVRGCLEWQKQGLTTPEDVLSDGQAYRQEEDTIAQFIAECCLDKPSDSTRSQALFDRYNTWCSDGNMKPLNRTNFGRLLSKKYAKGEDSRGIIYKDIVLRPSDGTPTPPDTMDSFTKPSTTRETASQAHLDGLQQAGSGQYGGSLPQSGISIESPIENLDFIAKTIHTIHNGISEYSIRQPVEGRENTVDSSAKLSICQTAFETLMSTPHGKHEATLQDVTGNYWCKNCVLQHDLMNFGAQRGYPLIHVKTGQPFKVQPGYEQWLRFAVRSGYENVRTALAVLKEQHSKRGGEVG